jgi:hypothetical protein
VTSKLVMSLLMLLVAACTSHPPLEPVRSFSDAYKSANDAGQPLLDDLAVAEKSEGQNNAANQAGRPNRSGNVPDEAPGVGCSRSQQRWREAGTDSGFIQGFCVSDAPYFASLGDPPATQAFRGGLSVLGKYVDVLTLLAEGRNIEELHARLQSLSSSIGQLLALVPGGTFAGPAIGGALTELKPLIDAAAQQANEREIRRLVIQGAPAARLLIKKLKEATPSIFNTLTAVAARTASGPAALDNAAIAKPEILRIDAYRVTVSNFVVLLNGLETALDKLVRAVEDPDETASVQSLAEETANLRIYADAVRKAIATLRQGG